VPFPQARLFAPLPDSFVFVFLTTILSPADDPPLGNFSTLAPLEPPSAPLSCHNFWFYFLADIYLFLHTHLLKFPASLAHTPFFPPTLLLSALNPGLLAFFFFCTSCKVCDGCVFFFCEFFSDCFLPPPYYLFPYVPPPTMFLCLLARNLTLGAVSRFLPLRVPNCSPPFFPNSATNQQTEASPLPDALFSCLDLPPFWCPLPFSPRPLFPGLFAPPAPLWFFLV